MTPGGQQPPRHSFKTEVSWRAGCNSNSKPCRAFSSKTIWSTQNNKKRAVDQSSIYQRLGAQLFRPNIVLSQYLSYKIVFDRKTKSVLPRNPCWRGRLSTVDLLESCFWFLKHYLLIFFTKPTNLMWWLTLLSLPCSVSVPGFAMD